MTRVRSTGVALLLSAVIALPVGLAAQTPAGPAASPASQGPAVALKVTVVLSKYSGDKKLSSLPFVLMVLPGERTSVQMSSQLPVPQGGGDKAPNYSYQNFGTNMTGEARPAENGLFSVALTISDSQMMSENAPAVPDWMKGGPVRMQQFTSQTRLLLRDGQTIQYAAATDKFTGEVVKVDVTLNVVK